MFSRCLCVQIKVHTVETHYTRFVNHPPQQKRRRSIIFVRKNFGTMRKMRICILRFVQHKYILGARTQSRVFGGFRKCTMNAHLGSKRSFVVWRIRFEYCFFISEISIKASICQKLKVVTEIEKSCSHGYQK